MGVRGYRQNKIGSKDDGPGGFDYAFKLLDAKFVSGSPFDSLYVFEHFCSRSPATADPTPKTTW